MPSKPAQSESPRGVPTMPANMPSGGSIDTMLAQIKAKAAQERQEMEAKHRKTDDALEELRVKLQQSQWEVDQLDTDKRAVHSQYLGRIEEIQTKQKATIMDNEKLKRENEKLSIRMDVIKAQKEALEKEKREVLEAEGGIAKKMAWLEERLEEERESNRSLEEQLKVARRENRESAQQALELQVQYDILTGENKRLRVDLDQSRASVDKLEMQNGHLASQMKLSEAIAAEHDELISKFHENQNKLRVAESELKANLAREQTLVSHVEAATQERVVYRIMLRSLFDKRNTIKAQCAQMTERMEQFQDELIKAQNSGGGGTDMDGIKNEREYLLEIEKDNEELKADKLIMQDQIEHLEHEVEETRDMCAPLACCPLIAFPLTSWGDGCGRCDTLKHDKAMVLGQCDVLRYVPPSASSFPRTW